MFGGTVGFNAQYGNFVFGLEGDASGNWMRTETAAAPVFAQRPAAGSRPAG